MVSANFPSAQAPTLAPSVVFFTLYSALALLHAHHLFAYRRGRVHLYLMSFAFLRATSFAMRAAWSEMRMSSTLAVTAKSTVQGALFLAVEGTYVLLCAWVRRLTETRVDKRVGASTSRATLTTWFPTQRPDLHLLRATHVLAPMFSVLGIIGCVRHYQPRVSADMSRGQSLRRAADIGFTTLVAAFLLITTWCCGRTAVFRNTTSIPGRDHCAHERDNWRRAAVLYFCGAALAIEEIATLVGLFSPVDAVANTSEWIQYVFVFAPELAMLTLMVLINVSKLFYCWDDDAEMKIVDSSAEEKSLESNIEEKSLESSNTLCV